MSKRRVVALAHVVRAVMERIARREGEDPEDLQGYCGRASAQLLLAAQTEGITGVEAHINEDHVFNVYTYRRKRYLIDITATQFDKRVEKVVVRQLRGRRRSYHVSEYSTTNPEEVDFLLDVQMRNDRRRVMQYQRRQNAPQTHSRR